MLAHRRLTKLIINTISHKMFILISIIFIIFFITLISRDNVNNNIPSDIYRDNTYTEIYNDFYNYTSYLKEGHSFHYSYINSHLKDDHINNKTLKYDPRSHAWDLYCDYMKGYASPEDRYYDSPRNYFRLMNMEQNKSRYLKRNEKYNISDVYNLIPFISLFLLLIIFSIIFSLFNVYQLLTYIWMNNNRYLFSQDEFSEIKKYFIYVVYRYNFNQIIYQYLFLIFPVIISVVSGLLGISSNNKTLNYILLFIILLFSYIQFYRIFNNYIHNTVHNMSFIRNVFHIDFNNYKNTKGQLYILLKEDKKWTCSSIIDEITKLKLILVNVIQNFSK